MWSSCTMEHCLAIKGNEALIHATAWVNPENIRSHIIQFHLQETSRIGKSIDRKCMSGFQGLEEERENEERLLSRTTDFPLGMVKLFEN